MKYHIYFFQLLPGQIAIRYRYNEVQKRKINQRRVIFTGQIVLNSIYRSKSFSIESVSLSISLIKTSFFLPNSQNNVFTPFVSNIIHSKLLLKSKNEI